MTAITACSCSNIMNGTAPSSPLCVSFRTVPETTIAITELTVLYKKYFAASDDKDLQALKTLENKVGKENVVAYAYGNVIDHFNSKIALIQMTTGRDIEDLEKIDDSDAKNCLITLRTWLTECIQISSNDISKIFDSVYDDYVNYCLI